jgi:hypothetical protein
VARPSESDTARFTFFCTRLIDLSREASEQERPEFALRAVNPNQGLMVEQLDEKTLHEPIGLPYWFR